LQFSFNNPIILFISGKKRFEISQLGAATKQQKNSFIISKKKSKIDFIINIKEFSIAKNKT